ncbi:serine/threonine-protein kinase [Actinoplanes sp. NPDC051494]|uniref:serine/threonine-protein kinase n=1 Tax=Actinoplanes sp. NPDC051494 TaxID=3363907 RepID=UPI0037B28A9A
MSARDGRLHPGDPRQVGEYQLVGRLGAGGMGVVYEARSQDGRRVAVKVIRAGLAEDDEFRARFRSEVARARQVPPFCTAEVLDADPDAVQPYLVVEFVDGPSLADEVARRGPMSASNLHGLAIGVATALAAIHEAGVIHRDLKPQNVLLALGSPKVIDFGIARALEPATQHTKTGDVVGSIKYMAPERFGADADAVGTAADVFAWGCVVAYAAQGQAPFDADSAVGVFGRIMGGDPSLHGLTGPLRGLVERSLSTSPQDRPTARELVQELIGPGSDRTEAVRDVLARQPEMRHAVDEMLEAGPRGSAPPLSRALIAVIVVLALTLAGGLGFVVDAGGDWWDNRDHGGPAAVARTQPSADTAMDLPSGTVVLSTSLATDGEWEESSVQDGKTHCAYNDVGLEVQNQDPTVWLCSGPELQLKGVFAVEVTGRIDRAGSCLGLWFAATSAMRYLVQACADRWQLQAEQEGNGDTTVLKEWAVDSGAPGTDIRMQVVVENNVVRVGDAGVRLGEQVLREPDLTGNWFNLGVLNEPGDTTGPFRVTFTDVKVWVQA